MSLLLEAYEKAIREERERDRVAREWAEAEVSDQRSLFGPEPVPQSPTPPPDTNPKTRYGIQKPGFHCIPPVPMIQLGAVMESGAAKYGMMNWREHPVSVSVYYNALLRHLFAMWDGEWTDPESGQPHLAHVMACAAVVLDAKANNSLNDDRPINRGQAAEMVKTLNKVNE